MGPEESFLSMMDDVLYLQALWKLSWVSSPETSLSPGRSLASHIHTTLNLLHDSPPRSYTPRRAGEKKGEDRRIERRLQRDGRERRTVEEKWREGKIELRRDTERYGNVGTRERMRKRERENERE